MNTNVTLLAGLCIDAMFASAIDAAELLNQQYGDGDTADHDVTRALLGELNSALAALPPDDGYRASTAAACEAMAAEGEHLAARWQMTQLARRLRAQRAEWESEDDPKAGVRRPGPKPRRPLAAAVRE